MLHKIIFLLFCMLLMLGTSESTADNLSIPIFRMNTTKKIVAITFDDGPHPVYSPLLLKVLRQEGVKATFFVLGKQVRKYPYITRMSYKQGHEIENHGYSHLIMRRISQEQIVWEIKQTEKLIKQTTGIKPAYFRPPYGEIAPQILNASRHSGYRIVRWSVDPRDWNQTQKAPTIIRNVEKKIKPGDILLFHDGGANQREMIMAVRTIIRDMKKDGYRFVTISTLIKNG